MRQIQVVAILSLIGCAPNSKKVGASLASSTESSATVKIPIDNASFALASNLTVSINSSPVATSYPATSVKDGAISVAVPSSQTLPPVAIEITGTAPDNCSQAKLSVNFKGMNGGQPQLTDRTYQTVPGTCIAGSEGPNTQLEIDLPPMITASSFPDGAVAVAFAHKPIARSGEKYAGGRGGLGREQLQGWIPGAPSLGVAGPNNSGFPQDPDLGASGSDLGTSGQEAVLGANFHRRMRHFGRAGLVQPFVISQLSGGKLMVQMRSEAGNPTEIRLVANSSQDCGYISGRKTIQGPGPVVFQDADMHIHACVSYSFQINPQLTPGLLAPSKGLENLAAFLHPSPSGDDFGLFPDNPRVKMTVTQLEGGMLQVNVTAPDDTNVYDFILQNTDVYSQAELVLQETNKATLSMVLNTIPEGMTLGGSGNSGAVAVTPAGSTAGVGGHSGG